ncbi:hypothetical protein ACPOL_4665 [Acidisarcina polymorpha]|uniref:Uncharacterized protein n=1 Tax=Acidisarcina polymorpha TaxID=2211140 RepID=A0A2Z5G5M3_9BACT|nr:hypothetical protein ACPOL_4665 [Acidisarcina polymorpha]
MKTEIKLPSAETLGKKWRVAIITAIVISTTPTAMAPLCTLNRR